ncbi:gliding motility protein [Streptomyces sp. NPDC056254]|uniref:gliding motility protein n=1 Tax=unclassified Streptomyces TaxID=2593676 RepID=UPI002D219F96|nr:MULTISPECIES: gliding motility protein [unclassified Streptomyces]
MTEEVAAAAPAAESGAEAEAEPAVAEGEPAEAVEIPKQQSAEAAADSEAGEGART